MPAVAVDLAAMKAKPVERWRRDLIQAHRLPRSAGADGLAAQIGAGKLCVVASALELQRDAVDAWRSKHPVLAGLEIPARGLHAASDKYDSQSDDSDLHQFAHDWLYTASS